LTPHVRVTNLSPMTPCKMTGRCESDFVLGGTAGRRGFRRGGLYLFRVWTTSSARAGFPAVFPRGSVCLEESAEARDVRSFLAIAAPRVSHSDCRGHHR